MKMLKIPALVALSFVVLSACASDEEYLREMEEFYRAECTKRGQGGASAYEACRKALIEAENKKWEEENKEWHRKQEEQRRIEAEANR